MMGAFPIALNRTTTLEASFFLYVSSAPRAVAGYAARAADEAVEGCSGNPPDSGTEGDAGDSMPASINVEVIVSGNV